MTIPQHREDVAQILEAAADGLESGRYGWTRGAMMHRHNGSVHHCAVGALAHETLALRGLLPEGECGHHEDALEFRPLRKAEAALATHLGMAPRWGTTVWNDDGARTKQQVIEALKEVAKDLRNQP